MHFKLTKHHRNTSDESLISDIKNVAIMLKKDSVTIAEYELHGKYHPSTLQRRFGSWFKVLAKAGLEKTRSDINIPEEELFKNIEQVWIRLGRQPKYAEMTKPFSKYSARTYDSRFGSWIKALEKFVEYIDQNNEYQQEPTDEQKTEVVNDNKIKHKTKREISDRLRYRILMRDGFTCTSCGKSPMKQRGIELHVDHILPWSKGGETVPENLETKCKKCNLGKGNAFDK